MYAIITYSPLGSSNSIPSMKIINEVRLTNEDELNSPPSNKNKTCEVRNDLADIVCSSYSKVSNNIQRHCSLPDIPTKINGTKLISVKDFGEDMKEIFGEKQKDSEYNIEEICQNTTEDIGARAKCLHSDLSDKSKSSTESSSASPSNEEIWHLADGGEEQDLKHRSKSNDPDSSIVTESDSFGNDIEKEISSNSNIETFSFWEAQRAYLESRIGIESFLNVYRLVADLEEKSVDEKLDYSDFQKILGRGNEDLIDNIIQLVVADNFFNVDQR